MTHFRISRPDGFSIIGSFHERQRFWMDPSYQRQGEIWTLERRQLLIDSVLNGFDLPKFYLHEFYPEKTIAKKSFRYAVIDGKQRLTSLWQFIGNDLALADDFVYLRDPTIKLAGLTHRELGEKHPTIRDVFNGTTLPIISVITDDTDLIEEMFSRLNDGAPLNAAEKRNTFGGPAPLAIRRLSKTPFFTAKLPFTNRRYRHFDLAAKFLFFAAHGNTPQNSKKIYLDSFVKDCKADGKFNVARAEKVAAAVLKTMAAVFVKDDPLLQSVGMVTLYYFLFAQRNDVTRGKLIKFDELRRQNRHNAEKDIEKAEYKLLEFDRLTQSPNDVFAIEYRLNVLNDFFS
jgi:hypothetical protein